MNELMVWMIRDCYAVFLCLIVVTCFLIINRQYGRKIIYLFATLMILTVIETTFGAVEKYLEKSPTYEPWRVFLSWTCYLAGPAIILTIIEMMIRDKRTVTKWRVAIPEFVNIAVTTLAFFTHLVFYYDSNNDFHVGPLAFIPRVMPALYLVLLVIISIDNLRRNRWESIIALGCAVFVMFDYLNELLVITPVNFRGVTTSTAILAYCIYFSAGRHSLEVSRLNNHFYATEQKLTNQMIDQAIETLAYTIDAKDRYTRGHSFRVAKYSRQIAKLHGMSNEKCREIYLAGLLHDIGKIAINESIINKDGELTPEEYEIIKNHPVTGAKILEKMVSFPSLSDGALYHHERYDGSGYPYGIKGNKIPEMARIIAVADAYDTMTSHRTYRESMDQAYVKQEIWKGMGTQFDAHFAKIMISLIDADAGYDMREKPDSQDDILYDDIEDEVKWPVATPQKKVKNAKLLEKTPESFGEYVLKDDNWAPPFEAVPIADSELNIYYDSVTVAEDEAYLWYTPTIIVYHSHDGKLAGQGYEELAVFVTAGYSWQTAPALRAKSFFNKTDKFESWDKWIACNKAGMKYGVSAKKKDDMIFIKLINDLMTADCYVRIPDDYNKNLYFAIVGECCNISNVHITDD